MEGKRVAAATLGCLLVMLSVSGQPQVAGFTGFCECFGSCYPGCREGNPAWLCTIKCVESCAVNLHEVPVAAFGVGDCSKICLSSICSAAETGDGKRRLLLHSNLALINFVFAYKLFVSLHLNLPGTTDAGAAAACVDDCTVNWSLDKNKHT